MALPVGRRRGRSDPQRLLAVEEVLVGVAFAYGFLLAYLLVPTNPRLPGSPWQVRLEPLVLVVALAYGRTGLVGGLVGLTLHNVLLRLGPEVTLAFSAVQALVVLGAAALLGPALRGRGGLRPVLVPSILGGLLLTALPAYAAWEFGTAYLDEAAQALHEILVPVLLLGPVVLLLGERREDVRRLLRSRGPRFALIVVALLTGLGVTTSHDAEARCFGVPDVEDLGRVWEVTVVGRLASGIADRVVLGAAEGATGFVDPGIDEVRLTHPDEEFRLYFLYKYPDTGFIRLRTSIDRAQPSLFWPLVLEYRNATPQAVRLTWDLRELPATWTLTLGVNDGPRIDLREADDLTFEVTEGLWRLRVDGTTTESFPPPEPEPPLVSTEVLVVAAAGYGALVATIAYLRWRRRREG